jgi:hypothetical protein
MSLAAVIAKINALRSLAADQSTTAAEAAAAAAAADALIQKHNLDDRQLRKGDPTVLAEAAEPLIRWKDKTPAWQLRLALGICKHYDCATYVMRPHLDKATQEEVRMVGRPDDIEAARYMFAWLSMEVQRLAKSASPPADDLNARLAALGLVPAISGKEWRDSFKHGAVAGIINAMHRSKYEARDAALIAGRWDALAVYDEKLAQANRAMREANTFDGEKEWETPIDGEAFDAGERAGRQLHTGKHLSDGRQQKRLK